MRNSTEELLKNILAIVEDASSVVNTIYARDFTSTLKEDKSPLTEADTAAHHLICGALKHIADYPILSEEGHATPWQERKAWDRYWLVDPVDGTKEFIKRSGEFTVNIGLIDNGVPVLGVVSAPALGITYFGAKGFGAWKYTKGNNKQAIHSKSANAELWRIVGSKSHGSEAVAAFASTLPNAELISMGSSLKICAIAEGAADIYPRFGPTSEWDTAAAHAIVEAAGGQILMQNLKPLRYNTKDSLLNPPFIVCNEVHEQWRKLWTKPPEVSQ